ncbi:glutamate-5-semialdehyde dehydrogenase [Ceratocystis pirilliformis]|uniref:glutamate-5-semialdehyde dehydrogenase n=1 Tax=Ceratocystis pirilliformis TaxID=259994 RepID=A0ABR3ZG66_9PEZI
MSLTNAHPLQAVQAARKASLTLATLPVSVRNDALTLIHTHLLHAKDAILAANARDLENAQAAAREGKLSQSLVSRLDLGKKGKFEDMLKGILDVRDLEDPIGKISLRTKLDDGLVLERVSCPIGVLLIIFEARPEVIANITSLAIKSGNAAILKGGKESTESFVAISSVISAALTASASVPNDAVQLVTTRDIIPQLLEFDRYIDLVIPRGSNELVRYIKNNTKIPVLGHADGICALYLAADADPAIAVPVITDSKTNYPAACNSLETLLVQESALNTLFPAVARDLVAHGVTLKCDTATKAALAAAAPEVSVEVATEADFRTEFLALTIAVKAVSDADAAVLHINEHGSHHTDVIITQDEAVAERFMAGVDSAGAYWNASSRMADGMRYGFGTEVGISTNKIHSRGPVGLEGLTIYKYKVRGGGHIAGMYGDGEGKKQFLHERMLF